MCLLFSRVRFFFNPCICFILPPHPTSPHPQFKNNEQEKMGWGWGGNNLFQWADHEQSKVRNGLLQQVSRGEAQRRWGVLGYSSRCPSRRDTDQGGTTFVLNSAPWRTNIFSCKMGALGQSRVIDTVLPLYLQSQAKRKSGHIHKWQVTAAANLRHRYNYPQVAFQTLMMCRLDRKGQSKWTVLGQLQPWGPETARGVHVDIFEVDIRRPQLHFEPQISPFRGATHILSWKQQKSTIVSMVLVHNHHF